MDRPSPSPGGRFENSPAVHCRVPRRAPTSPEGTAEGSECPASVPRPILVAEIHPSLFDNPTLERVYLMSAIGPNGSAGVLACEFGRRLVARWETGRDAPRTRSRDGSATLITYVGCADAGQARRLYAFSGERMPLACRFRRLAENLVPHFSLGRRRSLRNENPVPTRREIQHAGRVRSPGVPGGTLNTYQSRAPRQPSDELRRERPAPVPQGREGEAARGRLSAFGGRRVSPSSSVAIGGQGQLERR